MPPFPEFNKYSSEEEEEIDKDFNLFDSQRPETDNDGVLISNEGAEYDKF
nr:hypothetical protein [Metamycoplasma hominis]